jgi:peptidyl-prolyl cis-trans isomerase C
MMHQPVAWKSWVCTAWMLVLLGANAQSHVGIVNGVTVPAALLEQVVKNNERLGIQVSAELKQKIREELLIREMLAQEAVRRGLDRTQEAQNQLLLLRQNYLVESLLSDLMEKNPISTDDVRQEYERQNQVLAQAQQYNISSMVLATEAEAKAALVRLKRGERFDVVAREISLDASKQQGGDLGWLRADEIAPWISNVMVNLSKGATVAAPIQTTFGWHVIRLNDTRLYVAPPFEEVKDKVRQGMLQSQRTNFIQKLQREAKIAVSL